MQQFEFRTYSGNEFGDISERPVVTFERLSGDSAAKAKAGRMAKAANGPVDLALAGDATWDVRYLTTAMPSEFHKSGFRFERLTD